MATYEVKFSADGLRQDPVEGWIRDKPKWFGPELQLGELCTRRFMAGCEYNGGVATVVMYDLLLALAAWLANDAHLSAGATMFRSDKHTKLHDVTLVVPGDGGTPLLRVACISSGLKHKKEGLPASNTHYTRAQVPMQCGDLLFNNHLDAMLRKIGKRNAPAAVQNLLNEQPSGAKLDVVITRALQQALYSWAATTRAIVKRAIDSSAATKRAIVEEGRASNNTDAALRARLAALGHY